LYGEKDAGSDRLAVKQDRAGAAGAVFAAYVGAGQAELVAQEIAEQQARLDRALVGFAIYGEGDGVRFDHRINHREHGGKRMESGE
jgi:hypothetical protein